MRAAVFHGPRQPLTIEEVDIAKPIAREVLVRTVASGVCHSDLHYVDGLYPFPAPAILGHEAAGIVEAVGPHVTELKPGDHVIACLSVFCGHCAYCLTGRTHLCQSRPVRSPHEPPKLAWKGAPVSQFANLSSYAEQMLVHENGLVRVREDMPLDRAALIGCSVMTGVGAVINTAAVPPGASMAVFGVGGVGLNVVQGGALVAAHPLIAVDVKAAKLEHARALGATHAVDASREDAVAAIRRLTRLGADYTFVAVGDTRAVSQAIEALAPGGTCVLIGVPETGATVPLDVRPVVTAERMIRGCSYGSARTREDLPRLVNLYLAGKLKIDQLITHRYDLDEANEAFRALAAGELARGIIVF
jgi:S-(hydroxymethyl)glutathione dehydrogenase / alcohol dehydrogenase